MLQATPYVCGLQHMTDRLLNVDTEYLVFCVFVNHDKLFFAVLSLHIAYVIASKHNSVQIKCTCSLALSVCSTCSVETHIIISDMLAIPTKTGQRFSVVVPMSAVNPELTSLSSRKGDVGHLSIS